MSIMMALGEFKFSVSTAQYQSLKTAHKWRWSKLDRIGRMPAKQFQGMDASTKSFEISVYPRKQSDLILFQQFKQTADQGKPLRLVAGSTRFVNGVYIPSGADLGLWVIDALDLTESQFMLDGTALEQKGSLSISQYGEDNLQGNHHYAGQTSAPN